MITVVTYLWKGSRYPYAAGHVQQLARSVRRWLTLPHRFVCITNEPVAGIKTLPNPAAYPIRCYRRLWLFSDQAAGLGERLLHLDLDVVICGPLDPLLTRPADFSIYKASSIGARGYSLNPSVFVLRPGTQTDIWARFQRAGYALGLEAQRAGFWGSDQAVVSYLRLGREVDTIGDADGVVSFRRIRGEKLKAPPADTRVVSFHGKRTPFERDVQAQHPWILSAWREAA